MSFDEFNLSPEILSGLTDVQLDNPTPLQYSVIPPALEGKHLLINTNEHSGDDAAFLIPALQKLAANGEEKGTRVLILTPSIERAKSIDELIWAMGYHAQIGSASLSMKGNYDEQVQAVKDETPILVANPGRLLEILKKNELTLAQLDLIVIDEAHEMFNFNMVQKVDEILSTLDDIPQVLILSGNYNDATRELALKALKNPELIGFEPPEQTAGTVEDAVREEETVDEKPVEATEPEEVVAEETEEATSNTEEEKAEPLVVIKKKDKQKAESLAHSFINIPPRLKISTLMAFLEQENRGQVLIFSASRRTGDRLYKIIRKKNWQVASIFTGLEEERYNERLVGFNEGKKQFLLVAETEAANFKVGACNLVINYDVPAEEAEYSARALLSSESGASQIVSLVSKMDKDNFAAIVEKISGEVIEIALPKEVQEKKSGGNSKKKPAQAKKSKKPQARNNNYRGNNQGRRGSSSNKSKGRGKSNKRKELELPRSNYDKMSGGKTGESGGVVGFFKKLFS